MPRAPKLGWSIHALKDTDLGATPAGLYIVQPEFAAHYKAGHKVPGTTADVKDCYRCGAVGTKAYADEAFDLDAPIKNAGSLHGRMQMYASNWLTGGTIFAYLKLKRVMRHDQHGKRVETKHRKASDALTTKEQTEVKLRETQFHKLLDGSTRSRIQKVRGKSEWYASPTVLKLIATLAKLAHRGEAENLYIFESDRDKPTKFSLSRVKEYLTVETEDLALVEVQGLGSTRTTRSGLTDGKRRTAKYGS